METFCMPYRSCPPGMTTFTSTNAYCATATTGACLDTQYTTEYCECADPMQTPVYDDDPEEGAIGCEQEGYLYEYYHAYQRDQKLERYQEQVD